MKDLVNNKLIFRNFFSLTLVQGINALLQLLVVPFVILKIGIENFGLIAVTQVVLFFLSTIAEYGYGQTGSREVSQNRAQISTLSKLFFNSIYLRFILCIACFVLLCLLSLIFPFIHEQFLLYALAFVFVPGQALLPSLFFQGMEKLHWVAACLLSSKIIFVLLVFLFINTPAHTSLVLFFLGMGNLIIALLSSIFIVYKYKLKPHTFSISEMKTLLVFGAPVTAANLTMNLMQYGNLFFLRLFTNDIVAGYFSVAERIFFAIKQMVSSFAQSMYPELCLTAVAQFKEYFKKKFIPFFGFIVIFSLIVALLAPYIADFFVSGNNETTVFILRMLCIAVPVVCLNIPGTLTLLATNQRKKYFQIYATGLAVNLVANLLFTPLYFSSGTLAAVLITEIFITLWVSICLFKIFHQNQLDN